MYKHEIRDIASFIPYINNSRTHSDEQINQVASSIKEFGFTNPVLIDDQGGIIAGHGRILAAKKLGLTEIPCIILEGLTEAQKKAYIIADNQLALNSGWDLDKLKLEIETLNELDFDIELLGFDDDFLSGLLDEETPGLTDEDAVPEPPEQPVSVLGDIWQLGNHRLMCGDSTSIDAIEKLMGGKKADMVFTSPPYNADAKFGTFAGNNQGDLYEGVNKDNKGKSEYIEFTKTVLDNCFMFTVGFIFWNVNYNANSRSEYIEQIKDKLEFLIEQICWKKSSVIPYHSGLRRMWEPIFVFKTNHEIGNVGIKGLVQDNFIEISNSGAQTKDHRGCFPVELPEKGILIAGNGIHLVLEPFCGTGTTLIACEKLGKSCVAMELGEKYVDVIINRWQDFTGKQAIHIESGKTYEEMKGDRLSVIK